MSDLVLTARHDAVVHLTLNAPERRNALSSALRRDLFDRLAEIEADPTCRAVVLSGAGGCFCAGGDITEMKDGRTVLERRAVLEAWRPQVRAIMRSARVFVAAVDGAAAGAGFSLALLCDHVVAEPSARFSAAFSRIGLMPDLGLLWTLPGRIGAARAKDLMIGGATVDAGRAHELGIVDTLVEEGRAVPEALARAAEYARCAPVAVAMIKAALARGPLKIDEALDVEIDGQPLLTGTSDFQEGKAAFRERREARFRGA